MKYQILIDSPIGPLTLSGREEALTALTFGDARSEGDRPGGVLAQASRELLEYFAGTRRHFDVPLDPAGTDFQLAVWNALRDIPYGETVSYQDIAVRVGRPRAAIAVGQANSRNPIPVIIPCHRVIGKSGKMVGYTGGLHIKRALLAVEGIHLDEP